MHREKFVSFFVIFICFQVTGYAQNDTIWFNQEWNETSKIYAVYFRPKPKKEKEKYIIKDYYIDGQLLMEGASIAPDTTVFDGEVSRFYKSGTTQSQVTYKNGILNGSATQFFENGVINYTVPFIDGIQNGTHKVYCNRGNLRGHIELKNNIRDGIYEEFHENGNTKLKATFKNGEPIGDLHLFDISNKKSIYKYENDSESINTSIEIIPIEIDSFLNIDYSDIEPEPFKMIIYFTNDYGESIIKRVIVHPILRHYIFNLPSDSNLFVTINNKLSTIEHVNFIFENLSKDLYNKTHIYNDNSYNN